MTKYEEQIRLYYDERNAISEEIWTVLEFIDKSGAHTTEEENRAWGRYEELPNFVAEILNIDKVDVYHTLSELYDELVKEETEAADDYYELQRERRGAQGGE